MAVGDILRDIGDYASRGLKAAGEVAKTVLPEVGYSLTGQAPYIDAEKRQRAENLTDTRNAVLGHQIEEALKVETDPQRRAALYQQLEATVPPPSPGGPSLVQRVHKAIHPKGTVAGSGGPMQESLGARDPSMLAQMLGQTPPPAPKSSNRAENPTTEAINGYTQSKFGVPFAQASPEQQEEALGHVANSKRAPRMRSAVVIDKASPTGFSSATWDLTTGQVVSQFPGILPPRGFIPTATVSHSTDQYGNTTSSVSERTPQIPGVSHPGPEHVAAAQKAKAAEEAEAEAPAASGGGKAATAPAKHPVVPPVAPAQPQAAPTVPAARQLDASGHIPESAGVNPQLRELANQLLDDRDVDKIPQKAKAPAAALARQYGWEQGKFTPKEQVMLREATTFLQDGLNNPALKALDGDLFQRGKLAQVAQNPDKQGFIGRTLSTVAAQDLTGPQAEYIRWYNQMVGTISGLAQLVRSGRATEATIERLKAELPNPVNTKNSADAKARLQRLLKEITVAMQKGSFTGTVLPQQQDKIRARDPQGQLHEAPAGTPLPPGWKAE